MNPNYLPKNVWPKMTFQKINSKILLLFICFITFNIETPNKNISTQGKRSVGKGVLRNFTKFTGKHLHQSIFLNKVASLRLKA